MKARSIKSSLIVICLAWAAHSMVEAQPVINTQSVSQAVAAGGSATLSVNVSGPGPFTYQWRLNGTNLPNIITTVAGNGTKVYSGDGGAATQAGLRWPQGVAVDSAGNLFIGDSENNRIRKVDPNGIITTVAGTGVQSYSGNGAAATNARLALPHGVGVDGLGNLFFADFGNVRIRKVGADGIITNVAGTGTASFGGDNGPATSARINSAQAVGLDGLGSLFIADYGNNRIRKVDANGIITTVAGNGTQGFSGDGGLATKAALRLPNGVALDRFGNLFLTCQDRIRKVDTNGIITTVAGGAQPGPITSLRDGILATNAVLSADKGVAVDSLGNVFFSDSSNHRIRKVDTNGIISTVAGKILVGSSVNFQEFRSPGYFGDGGAATNASFSYPGFLALDGYGNLFIGDMGNNRIRKVTFPTGPTLALNNASAQNAGNYDVIVTGPSGSVTSSVVALTVLGPPEIVTQPIGLAAVVGSGATMNVSAIGTMPLNYQWFFEGKALADQTNNVLRLTQVALTNTGSYLVVVTNLYGSTTSRAAVLEVGSPPRIATQPANQTVLAGSNARFTVGASGTGPFTYDWRLNGSILPDNIIVAGNGSVGYSGDGGAATQASLSPNSEVERNFGAGGWQNSLDKSSVDRHPIQRVNQLRRG